MFKDNTYKTQTERIYKVPLCIQDTIPIYRISQGGIFELEKPGGALGSKKGVHLFDRMYLFEDINFSTQDEEEKEATGAKFETLLRSMNVSYKIIVSNHYADNDRLREAILHKAVSKEMEPLAQEYHKLLEERLAEGRSGLLQSKYFIISCRKTDFDSAKNYFNTIEFSIQQLFHRLGSGLLPLDAEERLRALHSFYRMGEEKAFSFDWNEYLTLRRDWRNDIINTSLREHKDYLEMGDGKCACALFVRRYANGLTDRFLNEITNMNFPLIYTMDVEPIQNTSIEHIKHPNQDPFWERAERMFLESLFLYVWMECPVGVYNPQTGKADLLERNWKSVMYLLNEAQFGAGDKPPKLDERMNRLEKKKPGHPAVRAYMRYRGGADETIRSVLMTVNARMQPFDNEELLEIFTDNEIPLDEFGVGTDGDRKTKSNLFIVIPDDDDTFNFVPGMVYTLLFQELYRQARFFGGKLPLDVGFWFDEFANIKMPNNFDKILATCRSRGVYCVPILQSLAQLKTLFADGAWEGVAGNCDTFLYLGGNEASTFEYVSKLLGKWTIDKRTSGESKGTSGSYSENYDVLGRELMLEYEIRLLPDDECILFVRGENPIRDKKWFPWEHQEYKNARRCGAYLPDRETGGAEPENENCQFISGSSLEYLKKQENKNEGVHIYGMDAYKFMMMDIGAVMGKVHTTADEHEKSALIRPDMIRKAIEVEAKRSAEEQRKQFERDFPEMSLLDIFSSGQISEARRGVIRELLQKETDEETIKNVIRPELTETEVQEKKKAWTEMRGK